MLATGKLSSTITNRLVFFILSMMVSKSKGRMVTKSMISTSMPSFSSASAAACTVFKIFPKETMVTASPRRRILHFPMGTRNSPSGIMPLSPYIFSLSMISTGSLSRMADFNSPFASYGVNGVTTLRPGMDAYMDSND